MISTNSSENIKLPLDKTQTVKRALTSSKTTDLLTKIKNRKYYLMSLIASKCGLRLGEILGLTWNDIDDKNCLIIVNKQVKKINNSSCGIGTVKSKNSNKIVPSPSVLLSELIKYKRDLPTNIFNQLVISSISNELSNTYEKCRNHIFALTIRFFKAFSYVP